MGKTERELCAAIATRLLAPSWAAFESLLSGSVEVKSINEMKSLLAIIHVSRLKGVKLPANSKEYELILRELDFSSQCKSTFILDEDDYLLAKGWMKSVKNNMCMVRRDVLLGIIDDLMIASAISRN